LETSIITTADETEKMYYYLERLAASADRFTTETWALLAAVTLATGYLLLRGKHY
jgi:hypothetical protein